MIQSAAAIAIGTVPLVQDLAALFPNSTSRELKVINAAPNPLQVATGADTHWIDSWSADVFCVRTSVVTFTPIALGRLQTMAPNPSLLLSVGERVGEIPGNYPAVVDRAQYIAFPTTLQEIALSGIGLNVYSGAALYAGAAAAKTTFWLFGIAIQESSAAGIELRVGTAGDDAHTTGMGFVLSSPNLTYFPFGGVSLGQGNGLWFKNTGPGTNVYGYMLSASTVSP